MLPRLQKSRAAERKFFAVTKPVEVFKGYDE